MHGPTRTPTSIPLPIPAPTHANAPAPRRRAGGASSTTASPSSSSADSAGAALCAAVRARHLPFPRAAASTFMPASDLSAWCARDADVQRHERERAHSVCKAVDRRLCVHRGVILGVVFDKWAVAGRELRRRRRAHGVARVVAVLVFVAAAAAAATIAVCVRSVFWFTRRPCAADEARAHRLSSAPTRLYRSRFWKYNSCLIR